MIDSATLALALAVLADEASSDAAKALAERVAEISEQQLTERRWRGGRRDD